MNETIPPEDAELNNLFALARANRPDTSAAEYAFETRLMARLRARREADSTWAMVSWRAIPFLAACVIGLAIWNAHLTTEVDDAAQVAYTDNTDAIDAWNYLN